LTVTAALLGLGALYTIGQNNKLLREIASGKLECERRVEQRQNDYQAEIEDLRGYIREQYERETGQVAENADDQSVVNSEDSELARFTERKYKYLINELALNDADRKRLMQLLLEREKTTRLIDTTRASGEPLSDYEARMTVIDEEIDTLLDVTDARKYGMLKESDIEQHHLREYADGITHVAPISAEQNEAILFAKLRHKQIFETVLRDTGLYRDRLSPEEREHAQAVISQALDDYKNNFLQDVQSLLGEEQFMLLNNYENVEFNWEKERLLQRIDSKR
jgi:hypothetical protein